MKKKTIFKIHISCARCKTSVFKTVAKLEGIDEISINVEKSTLTVIGEVDPVCITTRLRKSGKSVCIDTVGPVKKDERMEGHTLMRPLPVCCDGCRTGGFVIYESAPQCTIL